MRVFLGMILGALLLVAGVYIYNSSSTSTVASGQAASSQSHDRELGRGGDRLERAEGARPQRLGQAVVEVIAKSIKAATVCLRP